MPLVAAMTNGACSGVRGAQTGLDNTTEALEYADATGCSLSHDAPTAVQESVLVAAGEDEQQATEGPRGESRQASDRNTAQSGWKNASQGVRIQMSIAKNFMNVIMTDRTGAKLLDADTGTSHERKIHEHACMLLKELGDECDRVGNYSESKILSEKVQQIRHREDQKRRDQLKKNHLEDILKVESLELEETEKLTELWEQRLGDFKQNAAESRRAMEDRHVREHQELRQRIYAPLEKPKWSAHLLNLRKIQVAVAQQQDYGRAHMIQQQGNMLQAQEMRVMELEAMSRHKAAAERLSEKHEEERANLEERLRFGLRKRETLAARDFANLDQRYKNIKGGVARTQERELLQLQQAINSSMGLGKLNPEVDCDGPMETARPCTAPMRRAQHAYDWNVRFGNKAGNASTITSALGLSAVQNGEQVLKRRTRSGRPSLAVGSPTLPQPTTGGSMPFYLESRIVSRPGPLRPSSSCGRIEAATSPGNANLFLAKSNSEAALKIYRRPITAPAAKSTANGSFGGEIRPSSMPTLNKTRKQKQRPCQQLQGGVMPEQPPLTFPGDVSASPLELSRSQSVADMSEWDEPEPQQIDRADSARRASRVEGKGRAPDFSGIGSRPPGAGQPSSRGRPPLFHGSRPPRQQPGVIA